MHERATYRKPFYSLDTRSQVEGIASLLSRNLCTQGVLFSSEFWEADYLLFPLPPSQIKERGACTPLGEDCHPQWPRARRHWGWQVRASTCPLQSAGSRLHRRSPAARIQHRLLCEPLAATAQREKLGRKCLKAQPSRPAAPFPTATRRSPDTCKLQISLYISTAQIFQAPGCFLSY